MDLLKRSPSHVTPTQNQFITSSTLTENKKVSRLWRQFRRWNRRGWEDTCFENVPDAKYVAFISSELASLSFSLSLNGLKCYHRSGWWSCMRYMCFIHMEARETHVCECSQFTGSAVLRDQHLLACRCPRLKYSVCATDLVWYTHALHIQYKKHLMAICPLNLKHFRIQMLFYNCV